MRSSTVPSIALMFAASLLSSSWVIAPKLSYAKTTMISVVVVQKMDVCPSHYSILVEDRMTWCLKRTKKIDLSQHIGERVKLAISPEGMVHGGGTKYQLWSVQAFNPAQEPGMYENASFFDNATAIVNGVANAYNAEHGISTSAPTQEHSTTSSQPPPLWQYCAVTGRVLRDDSQPAGAKYTFYFTPVFMLPETYISDKYTRVLSRDDRQRLLNDFINDVIVRTLQNDIPDPGHNGAYCGDDGAGFTTQDDAQNFLSKEASSFQGNVKSVMWVPPGR